MKLKRLLSIALILIICTSVGACLIGCKKDGEGENMQYVATFIITDQDGTDRVVKIQLHPDKAPLSVENFTNLANNGYYDGLIFHRIVPGGCLQGGGYRIDGNSIEDAPTFRQLRANLHQMVGIRTTLSTFLALFLWQERT